MTDTHERMRDVLIALQAARDALRVVDKDGCSSTTGLPLEVSRTLAQVEDAIEIVEMALRTKP